MLTRLSVRNFKRFGEASIELGDVVVLIGPNNSGKTSALQALALWQLGVQRWREKRGMEVPKSRPGITINRRDLSSLPMSASNLLWKDLHTSRENKPIYLEIEVAGVSSGQAWSAALELYYANEESFYCRPKKLPDGSFSLIPEQALQIRVAFLPPMSGLVPNEVRIDPGAVQVRIGEGRTAEVLRNLCYQVHQANPERWETVCSRIEQLFGVALDPPEYLPGRGEVAMTYCEPSGAKLDLASAGRGLQQTLLLLAYLYANPKTVLLLDEPDAHLEILRQRQMYQLLTEVAREQGSQLVAASHSEVVLNEAADRDVVIAFVGAPHRVDDRGSQVAKSLKHIGFEHYYQAEQRGWVLYLEGSTDLAILRVLAKRLGHSAAAALDSPFVHYVGNVLTKAEDHFFGLREAKPDLVAIGVFDRDPGAPTRSHDDLVIHRWKRREIENFICDPGTLTRFAGSLATGPGPLFEASQRDELTSAMSSSVEELIPLLALRDPGDQWWFDVKATDSFLDRLFPRFFSRLQREDVMRKTDYHRLAEWVDLALLDPEVLQVLEKISLLSARARPVQLEF